MDRRVIRPKLIRCHCGQVNEARAEWCIRCLVDFDAAHRRKAHAVAAPAPGGRR